MEVEPRLIAQALALKKGDLPTYEKLDDVEEQDNGEFDQLINGLVLEAG